ncbi:SHOCT domain-containing protein [Lentzea nigeriaca]|uniref:SHOCT domain-containing protein n=1 Tax=Lentzea nigeriaca TaxID=1128665 RepID=UPI0035566440|nr:putative membrane protein [Lentzea nigeriaca]
MMYPYYGGGMGWGGLVVTTLSMIVFWGGLIALVVLLLRRHDGTATRILEERLAKGEIDADEFDRVRKTLRSR